MIGNFGKKTVNAYFGEGPYHIPEYQRDYTWEDKAEVKELWDDIISVYKDDIAEYFLGQVVVHKDSEEGKSYIIDGQQRSTTLVLLLVAFRNFYKELADISTEENTKTSANKAAQKIESSLAIIDIDDHDEKLVLSEEYNDFFVKNILYAKASDIKSQKTSKKAEKKLIKAYSFLYEQLNAFAGEEYTVSERVSRAKELNKVVTDHLCLLYVETTNESEAYMIFETLNARGRDLETSDLLKNYFFRISKGNLSTVKKNWQAMAGKFEDESITSYIRCIWNSQYEITREKMLYKKITGKYKTPKDGLELSTVLFDSVDIYLSLIDPLNKHCFKDEKNKNKLEQILIEFSDLKIRTYYPIFIAYYRTYRSKDSNELVNEMLAIAEAIEKLIMRDLIIAKRNPNSYEPIFAEIAKDITEMSLSTPDEIIARIKDASISDGEFESNFIAFVGDDTGPGKNKIRYILRKIINYQAKEMKISRDNSRVHIEHIMPQTKGEWSIEDDVHKSYLWRLGNLTLLDCILNDEIKNSLYDVKSQEYTSSDIKMTKELPAMYPIWNVDVIEKRQKDLFEIAKNIWSF